MHITTGYVALLCDDKEGWPVFVVIKMSLPSVLPGEKEEEVQCTAM
jgi:hypothetical protein